MSRLVDVKENELHLPNLCPNKDKLNEYGKKQSNLRTSINLVRKSFQPEIDASKYYPPSLSTPLLFKLTH